VQLVDALVDPVLAIDIDGLLFDFNSAAEKVFEIKIDDVIGRPVTIAIEGWDELFEAITHPPVTGTRTQTIFGANHAWYNTHFTPITNRQGRLSGWLIILHDITLQKDAETQATKLAAVVEQAHETIVITDLKGDIEYANPHFESSTGYEIGDALGQNPRILKSGYQTPETYKNLWDTITNGKPWSGQFINRRQDGSLYYEQATIFPIKDSDGRIQHFAAVKRDITTEIEAERALHDSERRYRLLADNVTDVIWMLDLDRKFTYISPSVKTLRGYSPEEVLRHKLEDALTPESAVIAHAEITRMIESHAEKFNEINKDTRSKLELEQTTIDGGIVWTEAVIDLIEDENGQILGLIGITRDITERRQAEANLRDYARYQQLLNEITATSLSQGTLKETLQILADQMVKLLHADGCYITLWDEEKRMGIPTAAYGPLRESYSQQSEPARPEEPTITKKLYITRQTLVVPDVMNSPHLARRLAKKYPSKSLLGLPLIADQRFLGAALISFDESHDFSDEEIRRGEQAAQQISLAVLKNQLLDEAEKRAKEAETLRQAGAAIASSLHQPDTIKSILEQLRRVVPYDSASVLLADGDQLEIVGAVGFTDNNQVIGMRFEMTDQTPNAIVFKSRRIHIIADAPLDFDAFRHPPHNHIRGWMGVPILTGEEMIGMLTLDSESVGTFTKEHARLATAFADQVAIALDNSRLFEETQRLAITDSLTGLYNRRHIMFLAERDFERARRYETSFSLIMFDIDHFKEVNDTYGHLAGDIALEELAQISLRQLRSSDTIGRYGGEEMIIVLPETSASVAGHVAERLRKAVRNHLIATEYGNFSITISLGVTGFDKYCIELKELIERADQALYHAKNTGRDRVVVWPIE